MTYIPLNLESLNEVKGGLIGLMLEKALQRVAEDIENAADIPDWRTVSLQIRFKPVCEMGQLDHVISEFVVAPKTPARVTSTNMLVRRQDGQRRLMFETLADNPRQTTIDQAEAAEQPSA